jgi:hypothetical protein
LPKTGSEMVVSFIWGVLIFALGFEGIVKIVEGELLIGCGCIFAAIILAYPLVYRAKIAAFLGGQANFLSMGRLNQGEIRVVGFGAHGENTSKDPITEFSGYVRSDLTNARLPIFIMAENPNATEPMNPFEPRFIPTRPEETFGIPGLTGFDIVTFEQAAPQTGVDGMPASQFLREFGAFTVVLEYDGLKVEHSFSNDQVRKAIDKFEKDANPKPITSPRVTRRPNATPPVQAFLHLVPPAPPAAAPPNGSAK